jgi:hypothetical protein
VRAIAVVNKAPGQGEIMEPVVNVTLAEPVAQPNFPMAVLGGLGGAVVGAGLWAVVTVVTQMELGIMAIAVGFIVGYAVRELGKGREQKFGILGAVCGLIGCVLGNLLSAIGVYAQARGIGFFDVLGGLNMDFLSRLMSVFFSPMDLLFYAIAVYEGYKFSFRPATR